MLTPPAMAAGEQDLTGRIVVLLRDGGHLLAQPPQARSSAVTSLLARAAAAPAGPTVPRLGLVTVRAVRGRATAPTLRALRADPLVDSAQLERRYEPRAQPSDPALSEFETAAGAPSGTPRQWTIARQGLLRAWDVSHGRGARVGIIDTGVDGAHPDLRGKLARAVDQRGGSPTRDTVGHGTHVSSLACAATNNGFGIAGTGYDCRLIVERSDLTSSSIAASIVDATDAGAGAINMSFGDDVARRDDTIAAAIDYAYDRDVVLIAAAADRPVEEQGPPANLLQPTGTGSRLSAGKGLTITAAAFDDRRAPFAGLGSQISLAAYGSFGGAGAPPGLLGAFPGNATEIELGTPFPPVRPCTDCRTALDGDPRWAYLQGTSMAAPQVAGVVALVRSLNPDLRADDVLRLLKRTARQPGGSGWSPQLGWGIVDAGAAVARAQQIDRRAPRSRLSAPRRLHGTLLRLTWSGDDPAPPKVVSSGIVRYEVMAARDDGGYRRIASTARTAMRLRVRRGSTYAFATVAVDRAGNREPVPARPDARTRVAR